MIAQYITFSMTTCVVMIAVIWLILMSLCTLTYFVHLYYADHAKDPTFGLQSDIFCKTEGSVQGSITLTLFEHK